ncbi:MAG: 5-formyltetrahydrofolate cyclo-ligase [Rhodocyclaceae bacterium]|nr:5-formyltetrahydrofolate cyclo-ligase [Rhodocyclaceae bacterium]
MADQPDQSVAFRAALRREKIAARLALPAEQHGTASQRILDRLTQLLQPRPSGTIAFCWPVRAEVDCRTLVAELITAGWQAAMPAVTTLNAPMQYRAWAPDAPMTTDPYGIPVPQAEQCVTPDVLLLPLVACDPNGYRLGYGGGYFDRTLAANVPRPLAIGVGFELAIVPSIYPEPHDIPLDIIVTEVMVRLVRPLDATPIHISLA